MRYYIDEFDAAGPEPLTTSDGDTSSRTASESQNECSPGRLLYETGLAISVPLALAALIEIILRT